MKNECITPTTDSKIKVEESGRSAVFINNERKQFFKIRIDGCEVKTGIRADYVVRKNGVGQVIIELKGTDIAHAAQQIMSTAQYLISQKEEHKKTAGLIVCRQVPSGANTQLQKDKNACARKYNMPLHVVAKNEEYLFEKVLAYGGKPLKKLSGN